ncbi:MAG: biopolymer transporter ExbD [Pseudomonadota bacterium]|jgi:biopolymer transport protein ExbD
MNFRTHPKEDEPDINLIPFIDVLLVVLIFLVLTTTYSKFTELQVRLPVANADQARNHPKEIMVSVTPDGRYAVAGRAVERTGVEDLTAALVQAAGSDKENIVVIHADAAATHQSVINIMDAARRASLPQLTFATQSQQSEGKKKP